MSFALMILMTLPSHHMEIRTKWLPVVKAASDYYELDWRLLDALIYAESHWNPNAESHVGAEGLTQLMPRTARHLKVTDAKEPGQSIWGGAWYIRQMYDQFGCWYLALAAYNAGPSVVKRYNGIPPYKETIKYVAKIITRWDNAK
jgi:soluble lytic murein transglycosylase-like protein